MSFTSCSSSTRGHANSTNVRAKGRRMVDTAECGDVNPSKFSACMPGDEGPSGLKKHVWGCVCVCVCVCVYVCARGWKLG